VGPVEAEWAVTAGEASCAGATSDAPDADDHPRAIHAPGDAQARGLRSMCAARDPPRVWTRAVESGPAWKVGEGCDRRGRARCAQLAMEAPRGGAILRGAYWELAGHGTPPIHPALGRRTVLQKHITQLLSTKNGYWHLA